MGHLACMQALPYTYSMYIATSNWFLLKDLEIFIIAHHCNTVGSYIHVHVHIHTYNFYLYIDVMKTNKYEMSSVTIKLGPVNWS